MIAAEYAGVLFTRDPSASGLVMIELVKGTAENLVSGAVRPHTLRFGRVSGRQFGEARRQSIFVRCSRSDSKWNSCSAARRMSNGPMRADASISCKAATSPAP
jgi:hypothetical protein